MSRRISGLEELSADEFLANPSLRTVSSFFVGWAFIVSLVYIFKSPAVRFLRRRLSAAIKLVLPTPARSLEQGKGNDGGEDRLQDWLMETLMGDEDVDADPLNLVFVLTVFAAVGSLSMFGSLLTFRPPGRGDDALCAFVVAWGDMSAQSVRIAGLTRLSLDLKALPVRRWEPYLMWVILFASLILMFVSNALSGGVLVSVQGLRNTAVCYHRHYVATSVAASVLNLVLEIYVTVRFVTQLVPTFLQTKDKIHALFDIRIARSLSFLLMDLLTMVPHAKFVSIPADFIPFSISALVVLVAFNYNKARAISELSPTDSIPSTTMLNIGRTSTIRASRRPISSRRTTMLSPPPPIPHKTLSSGYVRHNTRLHQSLGMPPFSAASLQWQGSDMPDMSLHPPESAMTWGSADARGLQDARIGLAFRNTRFGSASPARTPELVLSPGSSLRDGPTPRPNQTARGEIQLHSMYVDESGEAYVNVHPDQFPLPPPIFPLPPAHSTGVPKLRILTGTDITPDTNRSAGGVTPQAISRGRRNSYGSHQTEQPGSAAPSVVYGSDIVSALGSRNLLHNPSTRRGTLRASTIADGFADDFVDDLDMPGRSARSSQFTTTPLPSSSRSARRSSPWYTPRVDESDNGLSVVEEEGSVGRPVVSAVGGKRGSFGMRDKIRLEGAEKKVSRALSSRRSRRANSMDSAGTPLRSAGDSASGATGHWSNVPIMVVEPIPTSPISAPSFPTRAFSPGFLSPSLVSPIDGGMARRADRMDRGMDRAVDWRMDKGNGRGVSSAVRGRKRTRLVPRGPRSPEQGDTLSPEERLPRAYMLSPESESFSKQD